MRVMYNWLSRIACIHSTIAMMKLKVEQQLEVLDRGSASSRNISVANMGGIQSIGESI
jgi:hypothetical protein